MATINLQPFSESGLEPFTLNVPSGYKTGITKFNYAFVSSKEEYEQRMGRNFKMGLATGALDVNAGVQSSSNLKFGLTSTNLVIHYEELEAMYRDLKLNEYKLTEDALELLSSDRNGFREEYGDYFVAGYQYGGMYEAHISITTETTEQLDNVKSEIGATLNTMGDSTGSGDQGSGIKIDAKYTQEMRESLSRNKAEIIVEIKTIGAGRNSPTNIPPPEQPRYFCNE